LFENGLVTKKGIIKLYVILGVIIVIIALLQYITNSSIGNISFLLGDREETFARSTRGSDIRRVSGPCKSSNIYGQILPILAGSVVAGIFRANWKKDIKKLTLGLMFMSFAILALLATISRGALAIFFFFSLVTFVLGTSFVKKIISTTIFGPFIVVGFAALYFSGIAAFTNFVSRAEQAGDTSDVSRVLFLAFGYEIIDEPKVMLIGTGISSFFSGLEAHGVNTKIYHPELAREDIGYGVHNVFILMYLEAGIFMFLSIVFIYFFSLFMSIKNYINYKTTENLYLAGIMHMYPRLVFLCCHYF
jgi:O-antigen ligase